MTSHQQEIDKIMEEFNQIDSFLLAMRELIRNKKLIDLKGLDRRVENVCLSIQKAPKEVKKACIPRLKQFLDSLDNYEEEITISRGN